MIKRYMNITIIFYNANKYYQLTYIPVQINYCNTYEQFFYTGYMIFFYDFSLQAWDTLHKHKTYHTKRK